MASQDLDQRHAGPHHHSDASVRAGAGATAGQGHSVVPKLLRDPTTFEQLQQTLRTWSPFDPSQPATTSHSGLAGSRSSPVSPRLDKTRSLHADETLRGPSGDDEPTTVLPSPPPPTGERVSWAGWDELPGETSDGTVRRVLLLSYAPSGIAIWDCTSLDTWYEVLNLKSLDDALSGSGNGLASKYSRGLGTIVSAAVFPAPVEDAGGDGDPFEEHRPLLGVLTYLDDTTSHLALYSLRSHKIVHVHSFAGIAHRLQANSRHLIVSTSSPLALHVLSTDTFHPTPFSPLTDASAGPFDGAPVFSLGRGGRLLAYATTQPALGNAPVVLDREPVRPGAGILSHRGMFDSDHGDGESGGGLGLKGYEVETLLAEARTAGQAGGEVARKIVSGVRAIGDYGFNYLTSTRTSNTSNDVEDTASISLGRHFSKSAPQPSVPGWERRGSIANGSATVGRQPSYSSRPSFLHASDASTAGTLIVVDLTSYSPASTLKPRSRKASTSSSTSPSITSSGLKIVAHLRPYSQPLSLISLSPSSSSILTASSQGHSFDIFELKPSVAVGRSATQADDAQNGKVWHRYRLYRGVTAARTTSASWSEDGRLVGVGTGKGTTHIYAIQPFGGRPQLENHFAAKVTNSLELPPLSVNLSTIARIRRATSTSTTRSPEHNLGSPLPPDSFSSPTSPQPSTALDLSLPPSFIFLPKSTSLASSFRPLLAPLASPPPTPSVRPHRPAARPRTSSAPPTTTIQDCLVFDPLSGLSTLERLSAAPAPASPRTGDVKQLATTAVSGLSQLMKSRGGGGGGVTSAGAPKGVEWVVSCSAKAEWALRRQIGWEEVRESVGESDDEGAEKSEKASGTRFSAHAEIETFSRSTLVLPRSVYQSQQFDFFALPSNHLDQTSSGQFTLPLRRLEMRSEVQIRQGSNTTLDSISPSSSPVSFAPASFDEPIKSAIQTILDHNEDGSPHPSPKLTPGFPNGHPGKQGRWRDAIPIRAVAPTVRQGIGRVRAAVPTRRRTSSSLGTDGGAYSSSLSFEDDAVFADREAVADSESSSTAPTSEMCDDAMDTFEMGEDDEVNWGLDGLDEEETTHGRDTQDEIPFEEDFDEDFGLFGPPVGIVASSLPVPILDQDDRSSTSSNFGASPQKESQMLAATLSASPAGSTTSSAGRRKAKRAAANRAAVC